VKSNRSVLDGRFYVMILDDVRNDAGEPLDPASDAARKQSSFSRGEGYPNRSYDRNDLERGQRALGVLGQLRAMPSAWRTCARM
jgi:hypothetical protein